MIVISADRKRIVEIKRSLGLLLSEWVSNGESRLSARHKAFFFGQLIALPHSMPESDVVL
jgi:hypothetical protein